MCINIAFSPMQSRLLKASDLSDMHSTLLLNHPGSIKAMPTVQQVMHLKIYGIGWIIISNSWGRGLWWPYIFHRSRIKLPLVSKFLKTLSRKITGFIDLHQVLPHGAFVHLIVPFSYDKVHLFHLVNFFLEVCTNIISPCHHALLSHSFSFFKMYFFFKVFFVKHQSKDFLFQHLTAINFMH